MLCFVYLDKKESDTKQKCFEDGWLTEPVFKDWLARVDEDNTKFRCLVCHKTLEISTAGRGALTDHAQGGKHEQNVNKQKNVFKPSKTIDLIEEGKKGSVESSVAQKDGQQIIASCATISTNVKAEIIWTLKSVDCGFSLRSNVTIYVSRYRHCQVI